MINGHTFKQLNFHIYNIRVKCECRDFNEALDLSQTQLELTKTHWTYQNKVNILIKIS